MDDNINQQPSVYPEEEQVSSSPLKKILSLAIGLLVFAGIAALFFFLVLPAFRPKTPKNVTLTYWDVWEDPAALTEAASEFTKQNPNIKINVEKQDIKSLGKYIDRLSTRASNGKGPDVYRFHNSWITELKPLLLPLPDGVIKETEVNSKFYPVVTKDLKINGAYYGVPIHFDTLALFINTQLFSSAGISNYPATWDDLISTARQLTVKDAEGKITTSGIALGTYDNVAHASDILSLLMVQNGADLKDPNGSTKQSSVDALDFYTSFAKGDAKVWDDTLENSKLAFSKGNLAMYIGYSWDIFEIKALNPGLDFKVIPVPHLPNRESTIASYWVEGVSSKTKFPTEAFKFLSFLASRAVMEKLYSTEAKTRLFGELYPRSDMASELSSNELISAFVKQGDKAVSTIFSSDTHDDAMVDALNSYMGNAVRGVINNNDSPDSAIKTMGEGVAQVLGRYENTTSR